MANGPLLYQSLLEKVGCNLCGGDEYEIIYPPNYGAAQPGKISEVFRSSGDEILLDQLVRCRRCGFQFLNPRLRQDLVLQGYREGRDETFVSQVTAREHTFARCLKFIEKFTQRRGRILDVGTGGGSFLGVARQRGWEVAGCELNPWLSQWGRQRYEVDIYPGTVFEMNLSEASFDVVTLWDVLEHTPDPKAVLQECHRIIRRGGLLAINYPDRSSLVARLMGRKWVFLLSVHLYYFTRSTLEMMLNQTGFQSIAHQRHWQALELGYILKRMQPYLPRIARLGERAMQLVKGQNAQIPYWMGQMLVLACSVDGKLKGLD